MTVAGLQLGSSDSQALCEGGGRREREREREGKDENYTASLQSFVERRGGGEERGGWVGLRRCLLRTKRQGGDSNTALNRASPQSLLAIVFNGKVFEKEEE